MKINVSKVVYWLTLVGPVANAVLACINSISNIFKGEK